MNREERANYSVTEQLKGQQMVMIRSVSPDDKGLIIEALNDVSEEDLYRRFFVPKKKSSLTSQDLKKAIEVDFETVVQLVAIMEKDGCDHIAGGGRYVKTADDGQEQRAEIAFLITDAFQGLGIASRILKHLIAIGRQSGITEFQAEVLRENTAMLKVFAKSGLPVKKKKTPDSLEVFMQLTGEVSL